MMSIATASDLNPRLSRRVRLGLILALLGLLTFAAVRDMAGQCRTEDDCLAVGNGSCMAVGGGEGVVLTGSHTTRCELTGWGLRVELSQTAVAILRQLGVPVSYMGS